MYSTAMLGTIGVVGLTATLCTVKSWRDVGSLAYRRLYTSVYIGSFSQLSHLILCRMHSSIDVEIYISIILDFSSMEELEDVISLT